MTGWVGASVKLPKCNNTGDPFRSGVLKVMSLARFLCATPVKCVVRLLIGLVVVSMRYRFMI